MAYPEKSYYDTLGIPRTANADQIRTAYREQIKFFHPDVFQGNPEIAEAKTKELNEAYENLIDPVKRDKYDFWLKVKDYQKAQAKQKEAEAARQAEKQRRETERQKREAQEQAERARAEAEAQRAAEEAERQAQQAAEEQAREAQKAEEESQRDREAQWAEARQAVQTPAPPKKTFANVIWAVLLVVSVVAGYMAYQNEHREVERLQAELDEKNTLVVDMAENMVTINELQDFYKRAEECGAYLKDTFNDMYAVSSIYTSYGDPKSFRQNVRERIEGNLELVENCYAACEALEMVTKEDTALLQDIRRLCGSALEYLEQFGTAKPPVMEIKQKASSNAMDTIRVMYTARGYYWELTNPEV